LIFRYAAHSYVSRTLEHEPMDIYHAINNTIQNPPRNLTQAQALLAQYPLDIQIQLITSIYLGRDHIHSAKMRDDTDWTRGAIDHIPIKDYAQILYEKALSSTTYLDSLLRCSNASGYDLKNM